MTEVVIVLPGGGYTQLGPAIRFPVLAASEAGYRAVVAVDYPPDALKAQDLPAVVDAVRHQLADAAVDESSRVAIIAKSMGTRIVTHLADELNRYGPLSIVWLTPLFGDSAVRKGAIRLGQRSLIVFGDEDPLHDQAGVTAVSEALDAPTLNISGADHALEIPGDVLATVAGMRDVAAAVRDFLS